MSEIRGKTKTGFEYKLDDEVVNDYEVLELVAEVDEDPLRFPTLIEKILGKEQKKKLLDHVRKDGKINTWDVMREIEDIFKSEGKVKNS